MSDFIDAYDINTGIKHRVPAHWFDFPELSKNLSKTPRQEAQEQTSRQEAGKRRSGANSVATDNTTDTPAAGDKE